MEGITFEGVINPRIGYDFGPVKCDACGANSSGFVAINIKADKLKLENGLTIILCKGCLNEGEKLIDEAILSQVR